MKISVCLIVKDEEPVLARCLSCAVQFADELIVVDTGSSDNSVEIARSFTELVYLHPWQGSFAEARNYSYSKATGDYIMWLDADDVVDDDNIARINALKANTSPDTDVIFTIYGGDVRTGLEQYILRDRIIKRSLKPEWKYDIHEAIPVKKEWKRFYASDIKIMHKKEHVNDPNRNMDIFNRLLRENRELSNFEKVNLCKEYSLNGMHDKACTLFVEISHQATLNGLDYAFFFARHSFVKEKRYRECIGEIEKMEAAGLRTALITYTKAFCKQRLGDEIEAEALFHKAMSISDDPTTLSIIHPGYNNYYPLLALAAIADRRGDRQTALDWLARARANYPQDQDWQDLRMMIFMGLSERWKPSL